jgi:hypothetical protein
VIDLGADARSAVAQARLAQALVALEDALADAVPGGAVSALVAGSADGVWLPPGGCRGWR